MSGFDVDARWLLTECLYIGFIVVVGFLLAHLLSELIGAFGSELLYGVRSTLIAVFRYTTLLTALLYVITKGIDASPSPIDRGDD